MTSEALTWTHPEMARRYDLLVELCWSRGWNVGITSSTRSRITQEYWYSLYLQGRWPNIVADPNRFYCTAPDEIGGWPAYGSCHMLQEDDHSHALDLFWQGPTSHDFRGLCYLCGLHDVEPSEDFHFQWWDASRQVFPCYAQGADDMDQATFSRYTARALGKPGDGAGCTRVDPSDGQTVQVALKEADGSVSWWSMGEAVMWIHAKVHGRT